MNIQKQEFQIDAEPMIDAKQAACALRLPLYWFGDPKMRAKHRIPHYLLGGLVRFRMNELSTWAANSSAAGNPDPDTQTDQSEGARHDGL
jgi:hypothetical protein